jgi:DNA-binding transcriptional LysR family regulator
LAGDILERTVECFLQRHPGVRVELFDESSEGMMEGLQSGRLDLVMGVKQETDEVRWRVMREVEVGLIVQKTHRLAKKRVVPVAELEGEKLLLLSREHYPEYWEGVRDYFGRSGLNAKVAGEFDGVESMLTGWRAGMGVALIGKGVAAKGGGKLVAKALSPAPVPIAVAIGVTVQREPDRVLAAFMEEICGVVEGMKGRGGR